MNRAHLLQLLDHELNVSQFRDYAPNGLQVEGRTEVKKIVTAVTASLAAIDAAIERGADTLLVHHGYFWKGEDSRVVGMKRQRLSRLLAHDINLIAYHLPLDAHSTLGNNAQLAQLLNWTLTGHCGDQDLVCLGECEASRAVIFSEHVGKMLGVEPLLLGDPERLVKRIAWCSGGADGYFSAAIDAGVDLFLTGEVSEPCVHMANETGVRFLAAGHHATERGGVRALGEWIEQNSDVSCEFVDLFHVV